MKNIVDIFEILRNEISLHDIITTTEKIFELDFSAKEFLGLCIILMILLRMNLMKKFDFVC
jgi:hypothetical protein